MALTVSVALCTFNGARFLEAQLASIGAGSVLPDQLVIVDDASTDDTREIIAHASILFPGVELLVAVNQESLGVTANFARAIALCTSDIVVLCDQDDLWHPDRLERVHQHFDDPELTLVHGDARLIDAEGAPLGRNLFDFLGVSPTERRAEHEGRAFDVLIRRNVVTGATAAFRRSLAELAEPFPFEWIHDEWLAILAAATGRVALDDFPQIDYRLHGANQIGASSPTFSYKVRRMLQRDPRRNELLARRWQVFAERLVQVGAAPEFVVSARGKARFERRRSELPRMRLLRVPGVVLLALGGGYRRFASQGALDILRDLLQPR